MSFKARKFIHANVTFGRSNTDKAKEPFKNSPYYLWWEFLRRNEDYEKCCKNGGKGKLSALFKDFGDIYSADFKSWWRTNEKGAYLFAEEPLDEFKIIESIESADNKDVIYLQIPLKLPKRYLSKRFQELLNKHHEGKRGIRNNKNSTARYPITGHIDVPALQKSLEVFDYRKEHPEKKLWEIGNECKVVKLSSRIANPKNDLDFVAKKLVLANTVRRLLNRAEMIISGVADGKFPVLMKNKSTN